MIPRLKFIFSRYDPKKVDPTWICIFCHQGSHHDGLGDLFGPYFVSSSVIDIPVRNTTPTGACCDPNRSPVYSHPTSPSPNKSKQELAIKYILGSNHIRLHRYITTTMQMAPILRYVKYEHHLFQVKVEAVNANGIARPPQRVVR